MKYYVYDKQKKTVTEEITRVEYDILINFMKKYKYYENLYYSFLCSNDSIQDYKRLLVEINKKKLDSDINRVHKLGIYNITSMVLMLRLFIDNTKSYNKKTSSIEGEKAVFKLESLYEIKLLKALRDYTQHYSIPVTNTTMTFDLLKEEMNVNFTINKEELLENKENKKNIATLKTIATKEITFSDLVDLWEENTKELMESITRDFVRNIPDKPRKLLVEKFNPVESDNIVYHPDGLLVQEGKYRVTKEIKVFDSDLMFLIVNSLNYHEKHGKYN